MDGAAAERRPRGGAPPVPCRLARILDEEDVQRLFLPFLYSAGVPGVCAGLSAQQGGCAPIGRERRNRDPGRGSGRAAGAPPRVQDRITHRGMPHKRSYGVLSVLKGPFGPFTARGLYARQADVLHGKSKSPSPFLRSLYVRPANAAAPVAPATPEPETVTAQQRLQAFRDNEIRGDQLHIDLGYEGDEWDFGQAPCQLRDPEPAGALRTGNAVAGRGLLDAMAIEDCAVEP